MSELVEQKKKSDANDYSRFEKIADDEEAGSSTQVQEQSLLQQIHKASNHKDQGNAYFKQNQLKLAKEAYEDALLDMDKMKEKKLLDDFPAAIRDSATSLLASLYSNLAMIAIKEESWYKALTNANHALKYDALNVKVLFRRGVANARLEAFDAAKDDLLKCLDLEPANAAAKKELAEVMKKIKIQKQKEKASFGNIFSKGSVYDDREQERVERQLKQAEEKKAEEAEWRLSNEKRIEEGLTEQSFDEWKKNKDTFSGSDSDDEDSQARSGQQTKTKTAEQASAEKKKKQQTPPVLSKPTTTTKQTNGEDGDDVEYDEEEAKLIAETKARGYCYFRNTHGSAAKQDYTPKAVSSAPSSDSHVDATPSSIEVKSESSTPGVTASSWNYAGTWEERDMTEPVKTQLTDRCEQVKNVFSTLDAVTMSASITKVSKLEGEAQIVMARGKKRHIFDFQATLDFEIDIQPVAADAASDPDTTAKKPKAIKGSLLLGDISPSSSLEYSVQWKKTLPAADAKFAQQSVQLLYEALSEQLRSFEAEYCSL